MAIRITVDPASPVVGEPARVSVVTLAPFSEHCVDDSRADMRPWSDWYPKESPLRFDLKTFRGETVIDIPLRQRDADRAYWDGVVTFPVAGRWTLRMVYPEWARGDPTGEECAGARITALVRQHGDVLVPDEVESPWRAPSSARDDRPGALLLVALSLVAAALLVGLGRALR